MSQVKITLKKSLIGRKEDQKATIHALGLKKIGQTVTKEHNQALEGMIKKVGFMLEVEEA